MSLPENENKVKLKSASFVVIMLLHNVLTHIHSQKKPRLHFESFTLTKKQEERREVSLKFHIIYPWKHLIDFYYGPHQWGYHVSAPPSSCLSLLGVLGSKGSPWAVIKRDLHAAHAGLRLTSADFLLYFNSISRNIRHGYESRGSGLSPLIFISAGLFRVSYRDRLDY